MNSAMTCGPTLGLSGVLQCVAVICTVVGFKIELIEVLQYVACVAVCCSVSWGVAVLQWGLTKMSKETCERDLSGAVCCSVVQCVAVCCSVLQCVAVCCSVLQCVAASRVVLQCWNEVWPKCRKRPAKETWVMNMFWSVCSALQCTTVCCSVLQCVAVFWNTLHLSCAAGVCYGVASIRRID